jgi:hypothetical protein
VRNARTALGILLAIAAVYLIFSPLVVASALHRPAETSSQMINLRASWGGTLLGLAAFIGWLPALRPWGRFITALLFFGMLGIGSARVVGFALDGHPNTLQWIWLALEFAIAGVTGVLLFRRRAD